MAEIAVIIVNYGTAELALAAAESVVERNHDGHSVEVHLVDNASPGGDAAIIAAAIAERGLAARIVFHPEAENRGFGCGNNVVLTALAAREKPPEYVFLLNPDARLENEAISILADFLDTHPKAGAAGAGVRKPETEGLVSTAFRFPGLASTFEHAANLGPISRLLRNHVVALPPEDRTQQVDWVMGAAVMARFSVWRDLGFFDREFFLYYEEVDLMLRAARAGWDCWYVPEARVIHAEGAATGVKSGVTNARRKRRPAYWYRSWRHYFRKNHGRIYALIAGLLWGAGATLNIAVSTLRGRKGSVPERFYRDLWGIVLLPLLGMAERLPKATVVSKPR
jgi:GT2 family glycosyltransferase